MGYLRWAFGGGKYRRMAMEAWGNGLQKIKWIIFNRHLEGGTHRRTAMESIENGLLRFAAFAEIIQSLFEQTHAEELEDAEVDAAH